MVSTYRLWKEKKDLVGTYRSINYFGIGKWGGTLASYKIKSGHHDKEENLLNLIWRKHPTNHTICLPDVYLTNVNGCQQNLANAWLDWNTFLLKFFGFIYPWEILRRATYCVCLRVCLHVNSDQKSIFRVANAKYANVINRSMFWLIITRNIYYMKYQIAQSLCMIWIYSTKDGEDWWNVSSIYLLISILNVFGLDIETILVHIFRYFIIWWNWLFLC